jgi:sulfoxide reductase heme-binding subunit YedZ
MTTLVLLLLTLAVTPVRRLSGWHPVISLRRPFGLFAFFYASVHFLIWAALDLGFRLDWVWGDIVERPYITVGFAAFLTLIPLAVTSTKGWIRRLGRRWGTLHRLVYLSAGLGVLHFYWLVKADVRLPLLLAGILLILLAARVPGWVSQKRRHRTAGRASATTTSALVLLLLSFGSAGPLSGHPRGTRAHPRPAAAPTLGPTSPLTSAPLRASRIAPSAARPGSGAIARVL